MFVFLWGKKVDWMRKNVKLKQWPTMKIWLSVVCASVVQTLKVPQWGMLLLVMFFGLVSGGDAAWLLTVIGLLGAAVVLLAALVALGYDWGNPFKFLFAIDHIPWKDSLRALLLTLVALGVAFATGNLGNLAAWLLGKLPRWLAPKPDQSLAVVFLACLIFIVIACGALLLRRNTLQRLNKDPKASMNRQKWRAAKIPKPQIMAYRNEKKAALERHDYWIEAVLTLALAAIAVVPGALGWSWLWGVALSIVLPMFVLSVRFRMKNHVPSSTGNSVRVKV